jgi:hypothetical protein
MEADPECRDAIMQYEFARIGQPGLMMLVWRESSPSQMAIQVNFIATTSCFTLRAK